jgi:GNAT superfamily N-acetyltransferase
MLIRGNKMIRRLPLAELDSILHVVNDAAQAYKGVIPEDRWKEPYMPTEELRNEIESGVEFYGWLENNALIGVMGIQLVNDVTLIRHAYVLTDHQRRGIGEKLLNYLLGLARTCEVLVGTWEAAYWAVRFYAKHGFKLVSKEEKERLLRKYWNIPERQIETSVVLKLQKNKLVECVVD